MQVAVLAALSRVTFVVLLWPFYGVYLSAYCMRGVVYAPCYVCQLSA